MKSQLFNLSGLNALALMAIISLRFEQGYSDSLHFELTAPENLRHPVPATVRPILSAQTNIGERLKAIHSLKKNLNYEEITALYSFLKSRPTSAEKNIPGLHVVKNDILNALRDQTVSPAGLTDTMIAIYHDPKQDNVTRDYAIQHLISWYEQGAIDAVTAKEKIQAVLTEASGSDASSLGEAVQKNSSIAGTALLGLHRLSVLDSMFNSTEIGQAALRLAQASDTPIATRITALQICAEREIKQALPTLESLVQISENIPLRISAIAALGQLGGKEQAVFLRQLESCPNEKLRTASQIALRKLQHRIEVY